MTDVTQFICTHKKGIEHYLDSKRTRKAAKVLSLNVNTSDDVMPKSSGNWAGGTGRRRLMLSYNNNTQQQENCSTCTLGEVMTILRWNVNDTL
jgi:hypothetical protein